MPVPFVYRKHGQSGLEISELLPHLAAHADELCVIRSVHGDNPNHGPALFLMNNTLAMETARRLTARLSAGSSTANDEQRLEQLWLLTLGRPPEAEEVKIARGFIAEHSWDRFIQALLSTNEFAYLD